MPKQVFSMEASILKQVRVFPKCLFLYLGVLNHELKEEINLWIGPKKTITQSHYDISHNIFCQIYGSKFVILTHPSLYENFNLYPEYHGSHRQTQLVNNNTNSYLAEVKKGNTNVPTFFSKLE